MSNLEKVLQYLFLCHKIPERSFFYKGKQFPLCSRCTGILIGYFIGLIYLLSNKNIHIIIEVSLMIPIIIDGFGQLYGYWKSNNTRRLITGILAGVSTICILRVASILGLRSGRFIFRFIQ